MNVGEILTAVRYTLGETTEGFWKNAELLYWLNQAQNEHAQQAYSVKNVVYTTSIKGSQVYTFPVDFGELASIRYHFDGITDWELDYLSRAIIRDMGYGGREDGDPFCFFREQQDAFDAYGLFPIPNKPLVIQCTFEGACPAFTPIYDRTVVSGALNETVTETVTETITVTETQTVTEPVTETVTETVTVSLAVVLVIDNSGSMNSGGKIGGAKEGARQVINRINPGDALGIVTFADTAQVVYDAATPFDAAAALSAVDRISANGGTNMAGGLELAREELANRQEEVKLIVFLSDGKPSATTSILQRNPNNNAAGINALARAMHNDNDIIITAVALGADADKTLMRNIADSGGGTYHETDVPANVPTIFTDALRVRQVTRQVTRQVPRQVEVQVPREVQREVTREILNPKRANFTNTITLQLTTEDGEPVPGDDSLDPNCVYVSHVGLYMKRDGLYYPGNIWLEAQREPLSENYTHRSADFPADEINARGEWIEFDFTQHPIELTPEEVNLQLRVMVDEDYVDADPQQYRGDGVLIGIEPDDQDSISAGSAFIEMHRHRNDIEIEYYRNTCDPLVEVDDIPNVPLRYHPTLVEMTVGKANKKGGHDLQQSSQFESKAAGEILLARTQAKIATMGSRSYARRHLNIQPNIQYMGGGIANGRFRIRFGSLLGGR